MRVRAVFLGPARDLAGCETVSLDLPDGATVGEAVALLKSRHPWLTPAVGSMRFAVNEEFAGLDHALADGDEVAFVPPVSGGGPDESVWVELVSGVIPAERVRAFVGGDARLGGIVTFEGVTRAQSDAKHGRLRHLYYEAYDGMAVRQLQRLADEVRGRFTGRIAILHRVGAVPVGEPSVMIAAAGPHRAQSFEVCRWLIDMLKRDVPIWKKDVFDDGHERWVAPE